MSHAKSELSSQKVISPYHYNTGVFISTREGKLDVQKAKQKLNWWFNVPNFADAGPALNHHWYYMFHVSWVCIILYTLPIMPYHTCVLR